MGFAVDTCRAPSPAFDTWLFLKVAGKVNLLPCLAFVRALTGPTTEELRANPTIAKTLSTA